MYILKGGHDAVGWVGPRRFCAVVVVVVVVVFVPLLFIVVIQQQQQYIEASNVAPPSRLYMSRVMMIKVDGDDYDASALVVYLLYSIYRLVTSSPAAIKQLVNVAAAVDSYLSAIEGSRSQSPRVILHIARSR